MNTITEPWEQEFDDFDSLLDEEALIALDNSCKENAEEIVVLSDGEEEPVKTLQEIADEEEKDVYDPAILGMNFLSPTLSVLLILCDKSNRDDAFMNTMITLPILFSCLLCHYLIIFIPIFHRLSSTF